MADLVVLADHPFWHFAEPTVWCLPDGKWRVKWRDFLTYKQDAEFLTRMEAFNFALALTQPPLIVKDRDPEELSEADHFWKVLYKKRAS